MIGKNKERWCWSCIVVGVAVFMYAAVAAAQAVSAGSPVEYGTLFTLGGGLFTSLIGAYAKGLGTSIKSIEADLVNHKLRIADNYYTADVIDKTLERQEKQMLEKITEVRVAARAAHRRLDLKAYPPSHRDEDVT